MVNDYSLALKIHQKVNSDTEYRTDLVQYGVPEFWTVAGQFGDCEDYALAKRNALLDAGFDRDKIHLCTCFVDGAGHCVLLVNTDKGNYILDNRYEWPMLPNNLPYTWESILCNGEWRELQGFA